jgi:hypothetical protein
MKKLPAFNLVIILVVALLLITGCKKNSSSSVPLLTTTQVSSIDSTTAISGGDIFSDGGDPVTARGVCWSSSPLPTITDNKTSDGQGTSSFSSSLTGLTKGTLYYVRAYATNLVGTAYGQAVSFTTLSPSNVNPSQATTLDATNIAAITATLNGSVPSGSLISDVSFDYGLTNTYGSNVPAVLGPSSSGTQILVTSNISGLVAYTVYHFRVVLNTTGGLTYGNDKTFMTTY